MLECPFLDECEAKATKSKFKEFCQTERLLRYPSCPIYQRMLKAKKKQREGKTVIVKLTADAISYKDRLQLHYKRWGFYSLFCGPPKKICPPVDQLKKGTKIRLTLHNGKVLKVELNGK